MKKELRLKKVYLRSKGISRQGNGAACPGESNFMTGHCEPRLSGSPQSPAQLKVGDNFAFLGYGYPYAQAPSSTQVVPLAALPAGKLFW